MNKKAIVIGSMNLDFVARVKSFPRIGETIIGIDFMQIPGGKGANQAVAITKLGEEINFISAVGDDSSGKTLLDNLNANGIKTNNILVRKGVTTGIAIINVEDSGQNQIIIIPGANGTLNVEDISKVKDLLINSRLIVLQLEIPFQTVRFIINIANANQIPVLLNLSPVTQEANTIIDSVDYLILNEVESSEICGVTNINKENALTAIKIIKSMGARNVIITLGNQGAAYIDENCEYGLIPAPEVNVVDSTAAGDAFIGGFAYQILKGNSIREAVWFGNICGSITVTKIGAQTSLPLYEDVIEKINNQN